MKKTHIIVLIIIAAAIAGVIGSFGSFSSYETFISAAEREGEEFHVVGYLDTTLAQVYDPVNNPNLFEFHAQDKQGNTHKVVFNGTRPQDFERSEQLVMTGFMKENVFHCNKILMKCPSKYEDDQVAVAAEPTTY